MYISQCLIVKNEEENIEHCLGHLRSVVDEQIVVDTGSTDRTVEIAEQMGSKVFHFDWVDDFSAARNYAIGKAKGDWIIFLDCDEYFSEDSVPKLKRYMKTWGKDKNADGIMCHMFNIDKNNNPIGIVNNISPRIFKKKKYLRYKNRIHESLHNLRRSKGKLTIGDAGNAIVIYHTGYDKEVVAEKNKIVRNIHMIKFSIEENPGDSKMYYYLSNEYFRLGRCEDALESARKALRYKKTNDEKTYYPLIYRIILRSMHSILASLSDIKKEFNRAVAEYPEYPDYYYIMGLTLLRENEADEAIIYLEKCIKLCESYKMIIESNAVANIEYVYTALIQANILVDNKLRVVELCAVVLKVDKYNYQILRVLINTFLSGEKEESIFEFFKKIYDYGIFKDKLYLLKASEQSNSKKLTDLYRNLLTHEELSALEK